MYIDNISCMINTIYIILLYIMHMICIMWRIGREERKRSIDVISELLICWVDPHPVTVTTRILCVCFFFFFVGDPYCEPNESIYHIIIYANFDVSPSSSRN